MNVINDGISNHGGWKHLQEALGLEPKPELTVRAVPKRKDLTLNNRTKVVKMAKTNGTLTKGLLRCNRVGKKDARRLCGFTKKVRTVRRWPKYGQHPAAARG